MPLTRSFRRQHDCAEIRESASVWPGRGSHYSAAVKWTARLRRGGPEFAAPTAQESLKLVLRDQVGPALRLHGFKGAGANWHLKNLAGDVAIVNVQSSRYSSSEEVECVINLAVVPEPWWAMKASEALSTKPATPKEYDGLYRDRVHPSQKHAIGEGWWHITTAASARAVAADMIQQLDSEGIPALTRMLDRGRLIAALRRGDFGMWKGEANRPFFDRALAVMLSDGGPSAELDTLLLKIESEDADTAPNPSVEQTVQRIRQSETAWIRQRAAARAGM